MQTEEGRSCKGASGKSEPLSGSANSNDSKKPLGSWVKVTDKSAFSPRDTAEDIVFDGKMWLSNGYYHGNILTRDLWSSTDGITWTLVNPNTPYDGYSEMVVYDNRMWAIKGSVWHSTDGVKWIPALEYTPFGIRGYGEVVIHDGRMWQYVCALCSSTLPLVDALMSPTHKAGSGKDVWYSTDGVNWALATDDAPYKNRAASAVVVFEGQLWLMGGHVAKANTPPEKGYPQYTTYNDVWCSTDGTNWTRVLEHAPWVERMWFIAKIYQGKMWLIGGYDNVNHQNLGDVWYSEDGVNWYEFTAETRFSPRHEPTCYVYDNSLWVVAGNSWPVMNDVWRLTLPSSH